MDEIDTSLGAVQKYVAMLSEGHLPWGSVDLLSALSAERDELAAKLAEALSRDATRELLLKEAQANCDESDELLDAQKAKLDALAPHGTCACSVDKPGDLCMHHSPQLVAANAEIARRPEVMLKADGVWLRFKTKIGLEALLELGAIADRSSGIIRSAINQWINEQRGLHPPPQETEK